MKNKILVVGIGQCGNKIAEQFGKNKYQAIGINTAEEDMKSLNNINKLKIGSYGGSGKDRSLAIEQLKEDFPKIFNEIREQSNDKDIIVLVSSLGGGTGSGSIVATALNVSKLGKKVIVIGVLPIETEGVNLKNNTLDAIAELNKIKDKVNIMLVRNSSEYDFINKKVFNKINSVMSIDGQAETSFDRMDLLNSFMNGYLDIQCGNSQEVNFKNEFFDLSTAMSINLVTSTRKKIKGDDILNNYKAIFKNYFNYKSSEKDSYTAVFSKLSLPVDYINNTKEEIRTAYEQLEVAKDNDIDFSLGFDLNLPSKSTTNKPSEKIEEEMEFVFDIN